MKIPRISAERKADNVKAQNVAGASNTFLEASPDGNEDPVGAPIGVVPAVKVVLAGKG